MEIPRLIEILIFDIYLFFKFTGSVNKLVTENNEQVDEEDDDEEAERDARERFRSERTSSTNPATFRNIPDSLGSFLCDLFIP